MTIVDTASTCVGCISIQTVFPGLTTANASNQIKTYMETRYSNAGGDCTTFATNMQTVYTAFYQKK